jgi:phage terminase small subunit
MPQKLTPKQQCFVDEYLVDLNGARAARAAGYSARSAEAQASRLLTNAKVAAALSAAMVGRSKRVEITADFVLTAIRDTVARCQQAEPVMMRNSDGELVATGEYKFDAQGVLRGCELLGKHLGLYVERRIISGDPENPIRVYLPDNAR